jgi:hypothetical protein
MAKNLTRKTFDVNSDPRVVAALVAFGEPVFGEYAVTATAPLTLTKSDGRVRGGWESPGGIEAGRIGAIAEHTLHPHEEAGFAWAVRLPGAYGARHTAMVVRGHTEGARITHCPEIREGVPDVEWVLRLLANFVPRPGAAGLLSRVDPEAGSDADRWHGVFLRLIDEGAVSEAMLRAAITAENARYDALEATRVAEEEAANLRRIAERDAKKSA